MKTLDHYGADTADRIWGRSKMKDQSPSIALLAEFEGQKLQGRTIAILSNRIDVLIRLAVGDERQRCHDATKQAFVGAIGEILENAE